uniref:TPR repeat region-containing protein n=1 Tax=Nocardiopsis salina TaxID=245836 RepID=UPI00034947D0|nr:hypothetical protein [Nocardiopsis salina]
MDEARALSQMFGQTTDDLQGGYGLSTNLALSTGSYANYWGDSGDDHALTDAQMYPLVDVASRNKDANYFMLTGTHHNPELGVDIDDSQREQAFEGLFTHRWNDEGETVSQFTDWLSEDLDSDDYQESSRAGRGFAGFMETITDDDMPEKLMNTGTHLKEGGNEYQNASFTQYNIELAHSLSDMFDAHVYSFANGDVYDTNDQFTQGIGQYRHSDGFIQMGTEERATFMQFLMGNDETAVEAAETVDLYHQMESATFLGGGASAETSRGSGTLQGLFDHSLKMESESRYQDLGEQVDREEEVTGIFVTEAGNLSEKIPVVGTALSKGIEHGKDGIVEAIVDGEFDKTEWSVRSGNLNWLDGPFETFMRYSEVTWCATVENAWDFVTAYVDEFEDTYETQAEYLESIEDYVDCGDGRI